MKNIAQNKSLNRPRFKCSQLLGFFLSLFCLSLGCSSFETSQTSEVDAKLARIIIAEDSRTFSDEFKELLHDQNPKVRAFAARAVGRIGIDAAPLAVIDSMLKPILHDSLVEVASMAAFAYGLLPKDSTIANDLVEFAFTAPEPAAVNAIVAAGRLADSANTPVIQKMLILLNHPGSSYRSHTAMALLFCKAKSTFNELARVALSDEVKTVRDTALYALARMAAAPAQNVYLSYLSDTSSYLQALALRGLIAVKDTILIEKIMPFLSADDANLRSQAITTLGALQCKESKEALIEVVKSENDDRLRAQALSSLASFSGERKDKLAEQFLTKSHDLGLQSASVLYLAGSFGGVLSPILDSVFRDGNPQLLSSFFDGVNRTISKNILYEFCEELLHAPQYRAPGPAYYSAYALYDELELKPKDWMQGAALWDIIISDTDFVIKGAMLEYAGRRKAPWFFDVALPLARLVADSDNQIRVHEYQDIYRSLLGATDSYIGASSDSLKAKSDQVKLNVREIFDALLQSDDFIVSKQASEHLRKYFPKYFLKNIQSELSPQIYKPQSQYQEGHLAELLADAKKNNKLVTIKVGSKQITIELDFQTAPLTCLNFLKLIEDGSYQNLVFHRVIPNFVAQSGDPRGDGWGGPGYSIRCEYSQSPYVRGAVGIATSGKDTGGSQFFITLAAQPHLDARYTVFAKVMSGIDVADMISKGDSGIIVLAE